MENNGNSTLIMPTKVYDENELIFQLAPVAIVEVDENGEIIKSNAAASKLFAKITSDITKKNILEFANSEDREGLENYFEKAKIGKVEELEQVEVKHELNDSETEIFLYKFAAYPTSVNKPIRIIAAVEDITARKEEEQYIRRYFEDMQAVRDDLEERTSELAFLNEKLHQSESELEEINRNKNKFFSIISHDLRSPFTSLLGLTKLMLDGFDDFSREEIKESIYHLQQVSQGLFKLVEDLLDWSRIQFNRVEFQPSIFNLFDVVTTVVQALKSVAKDKNISVVNLVSKNCYIYADPHMINAIIRNLVNNSIKFTPKYGLIKISSGFDLEDLIISVEDTGIGMTKEIASSLFKIENKITSNGTEGETGTGLGLLICKEFIEKHNGKIWAKSQVEKGSSFYIRLPIEPEKISLQKN